jgi:hypothetical protein
MPIRRGRLADIQAQQVEVGRIRLGATETKQGSKGEYQKPVKLDTFRLTSRSQELIEEAALLYGGQCEPWQPQSGGAQQWQVFTQRRSIAVIVPPEPCSQYYEAWTGGKCQRRCDGVRELINDVPCPCGPDPSQRRCKPTTRLSLMLAEMSGIGVWRLETHGYYAAAELPAVADLLSAAGGNVSARLEMEERQAMVTDPRDPSKEVATRFMVPVLHVQHTPAQLVQILGSSGVPALQATSAPPGLPPVETDPWAEPPALTAAVDPAQERMRVQWTLHTQFEDQIAQATTAQRLGEIGRAIRQGGLDDQFEQSLRLKWKDRQAQLAAQTPQPPAPASGVPAQNGAGQVDRVAEFQALQATASAQGLTLSALRDRFAVFTEGGVLTQATGEQLAAFHADLRGEGA